MSNRCLEVSATATALHILMVICRSQTMPTRDLEPSTGVCLLAIGALSATTVGSKRLGQEKLGEL